MSESTATLQGQTVVVAGGSGFIGRHLTPALAAAGYQVVVLGRGRQPAGDARPDGVRFVTWQPGAPDAWQQHLSGARAVVNLCGAGIGDGRWTAARKRELLDSRTVPSHALVAACNALEHPPAMLLQASGVGYYGTGTGDATVDESSAPGEDFLARLAVAWESPLEDAALAAAGVTAVRLRFGVVLGRDGGALPQMLLPFRLFAGGPVASGQQWLSWIHVDDLVAALLHLIGASTDAVPTTPLPAAFNVCAPHPVQNREFAASAARALHRPAWLRLPRMALQAALGEQATLVCDGQRALPRALQATGFEFRYPRIDQALQQLLR
ncbi:MAG: TIGR01777 family oxidoreductase [Pseudomonadales bacterium]